MSASSKENKPVKKARKGREDGDNDSENGDNDSENASSDESEESSSSESEQEDWQPEDNSSSTELEEEDNDFDSDEEVLPPTEWSQQQHALYVGVWDDVPHVIQFQLRSKLNTEKC